MAKMRPMPMSSNLGMARAPQAEAAIMLNSLSKMCVQQCAMTELRAPAIPAQESMNFIAGRKNKKQASSGFKIKD